MKNLFKILFKSKYHEPQVGDIYVDPDWGDTFVKIVRISKNKKRVRYIYNFVKGEKIDKGNIYETTIRTFKEYKTYIYYG